MDILTIIQKQYLSFSNKEKNIADYILSESKKIKNMNISVFANNSGVSDGTVTRFCKKIGCESFADLKIHLSSINNNEYNFDKVNPLEQVYQFYKEIIDRTNRMMQPENLQYIASEIYRARYIYIYGLGSSGLTANEFMLRLMRMGFQGQCITDSHLMIINSSIVSPQDLVIAISVSGETMEVVNAAAISKNNNCKVLCLTCFENSSLSQNVDYCFLVPNSTLIDKENFINSQFSFMYVVDLLTTIFMEDKNMKNKMQITINTIIDKSHVKK